MYSFGGTEILFIGGIVGLIAGLWIAYNAFAQKPIQAVRAMLAIVLIVIGVFAIVNPVIHTKSNSVDSLNESIVNMMNDHKEKIVRVYFNEVSFKEYRNVITVELANDNVIAFITSDGLRHALRPGDSFVEVTEDLK